MLGLAARDAQQRQVNNKILCALMEAIFAPIVALVNDGLDIECADGKVQNVLYASRLGLWITWIMSRCMVFKKISVLSARFDQNSQDSI